MKKLKIQVVAALAASTFMAQSNSVAMGLQEYLQAVQGSNKNIKSIETSLEAAETRYQQADLELSPILTARGFYQDDKSTQYSTSSTIAHQQIRQYSLGLGKKFSTGTQLQATTTIQAVNTEGVAGINPINAENHTGTVGVSLSQSLLKNFFGEQTKLRWQRESLQKKLEVSSVDLQKRQFLADSEALYWDFIYLQNELELRKTSLERAKRIESWVTGRASNGIGDKADILNAQGLVAARELQLISTRDELRALQERLALQLELKQEDKFPSIEGDLGVTRTIDSLLQGTGNKVIRLDAYLGSLESETKAVLASEAQESVMPDLTLDAQYKTNGYDTTDSGAASKMTNSDKPVFGVGLTLSWALDWDSKGAIRSTAAKDALAAKYKREKKLQEGESAWRELSRRHFELSARIKAASELAKVQVAKAGAERDKLSKGRSVTSNVVTAEQDAAEAELTLAKLKAEQRKLESLGRLFVRTEEAL